ncbi:MAG: hypothetical protein F4Z53_02315 [Acidimicrobiales bacterium]|nr:hypothetical protein [Acidimicrobiales bacterium]MYD32619.1 hypothetical protein [Acidimicrobiales bacterium]MYI09405.1 hypothetical protein [Acidimicrobiales bacterium]
MRWLLDEMLPHTTANILNELGHDAVSVVETELRSAADEEIYATAAEQDRVVVTEDRGDFGRILKQSLEAGDALVPVIVVRRTRLGRGGAMPTNLANALHRWSLETPEPLVGPHYL